MTYGSPPMSPIVRYVYEPLHQLLTGMQEELLVQPRSSGVDTARQHEAQPPKVQNRPWVFDKDPESSTNLLQRHKAHSKEVTEELRDL